MNHQEKTWEAHEDEISLLEIWQILVARKWIVLACPLLLIMLAVGYLYTTKPIFESNAQVLVGQVGQVGQVENPSVTVQRLSKQYHVNGSGIRIGFPRVTQIQLDRRESGNIITISVQDYSPEGAKAYLSQVVTQFVAEQKRLFEQVMQMRLDRLQVLNKREEALATYQDELEQHIEAVRQQDPAHAALLIVEKGKYLELSHGIEKDLFALEMALSEMSSYPTQLLWEPFVPQAPVKPKRKLVLALAAMSGLFVGVMMAFLVDYVIRSRQTVDTV